jgi:hypothetical protein
MNATAPTTNAATATTELLATPRAGSGAGEGSSAFIGASIKHATPLDNYD